ncbi:uncharacterized protein OCT59_021469 [Rhizophagus irregularis]|uniref:uncharacterized protein n=1 Tax=Rhizophagus irregularis TaxID=588596 RepID=UPI00332C7623|nr:hypothetical protein OCT59_021469 [Rhizophagus irregularis]
MKYTLNWVVFGNNPYKDNFSVNIGVDTNINLLKKAIREDITAPDSIKAKDLKLFKVDLPLRGNKDENVINICTNNIGDAGVEMSEGLQKVSDYFLFSQIKIIYTLSYDFLLSKLLLMVKPPRKRAKIEETDYENIEEVDEILLKHFWQALKNTINIDYYSLAHGIDRRCKFFWETKNLRLTGNSGIGKTFFGYYLIYHLVKNGKTVIYDIHTMKTFVILFGQTIEEVSYLHIIKNARKIKTSLSNRDTWYIVDGKSPDDSEAKTILICSSLKSHYKVFDNRIPEIRYMPVWSWNEINKCRTDIFTHLNEDKVRELYIKWGGIPRYILEGIHAKGIQKQLDEAINTCNESIFKYIEGDIAKDDISHKLIHIWTNFPEGSNDNLKPLTGPLFKLLLSGQPPADLLLNQSSTNLLSNQPSIDLLFDQSYQSSTDLLLNQPLTDLSLDQSQIQVECIIEEEYYTETIVKFASNYIGQQVILKLKKIVIDKCHRDVNAVINGSKSNPVTDCVFEQIAHKILQNGGTFKRRSLDTNEEDSIVFLKHDLVLLTQIDEIQNEAYSILLDKSFPLVDAIIAPNCLLQMTIAKDHNIKISGLKRVQSKLETESNIYFYFVVPTKLYSSYKKQKYSTTGDKNALNMEPWIGKHLKQYVLEIDLACLEYKM